MVRERDAHGTSFSGMEEEKLEITGACPLQFTYGCRLPPKESTTKYFFEQMIVNFSC
jgi:hypothetical protein